MGSKIYNFLGYHGEIANVEACLESIKRASGATEVDIKYINCYATTITNSVRYFDENVIEIKGEQKEKDRNAKYKWVPTGYTCGKYDLYASFYKIPVGWAGAYIGTEERIREKVSKYAYKKPSVNFKSESDINEGKDYGVLNGNKFCMDIYDRLLIREQWARSKRGNSRLSKYIEAIASKVQHNIKNNITNGYIISENNSKVLMNTGLIDKFMNDVYVYFDIIEDRFENAAVVENKIDLVRKGFNKESIKFLPRPLKFYDRPEELIFNASIDDFDIEDIKRLNHIINERRSRFPESYNKIGEDIICGKLRASIEKAIKLTQRDYKYVIPMYNTNLDTIQFLMPLHLDRSIEESPELVLVVGKIDEFYTVMTILQPDDAYDNARVIAKPDNSWLQPE